VTILVALSTFAERDRRPLQLLERSALPFAIHPGGKRITTPELLREGRDAAVVIAGVEPYDATTLERLPTLRCIVRCGVGVDAVDLAAARQRGICVLNTPDAPTSAVAELALAMMLALSRNLRRQANVMSERRWQRLEAHLIAGRTVGIVGLGRIGRRVAELCRALGARVVATDPAQPPQAFAALGVEPMPLELLLQESDIVSIHAARSDPPLAIGAPQIRSMKPGAVLINLARGGMVDEAALADALRSGSLAGAGLDVFAEEPYAGPLCEFDNVILTPHSATLTVETRAAMELECVDKAVRFLRGEIRPEERVA
jgi:D-3-phosphoglycerate dehydrogenase